MPVEYPKIERAVELAIDMINENEVTDIRLNGNKLSASFHISDLYNSYDNFQKGKKTIICPTYTTYYCLCHINTLTGLFILNKPVML